LVSTLRLLAGVIDIYMPDVKYGAREAAQKYSGAPEYFDIARDAVAEMHRQVGVLRTSRQGIAQRGLLVRHLVLPGGLAGSEDVLSFLQKSISSRTYVSIMSQYFPAYKATGMPELNRKVTGREYEAVVLIAEDLGLIHGWQQPSPEP
jgi:putative pyruvate formate lyase activating enzyme